MSDHQFKIGQTVTMRRPFPDRTGSGTFEVVRLLPESVDGELHYRIRGADRVERAVGESQLAKVGAFT